MSNPNLEDDFYLYTNLGESETDIFTFSLENVKPLSFLNTHNYFGFFYTFMDKKSNFNTYSDQYKGDEEVFLEGEKIAFEDLPVVYFYDKHSFRVSHVMELKRLNISFSNFINFTTKKDALTSAWAKDASGKIIKDANGNFMKAYTKEKIPSYATWDIRISYEKKLQNNLAFFSNFDINNILNKQYLIDIDNYGKHHGVGRNFWLEVGLRW